MLEFISSNKSHGSETANSLPGRIDDLLSLIDDGLCSAESAMQAAERRGLSSGRSAGQVRKDPKSARFLIVDDEPLNIDVVRGFLEIDGYWNFICTTQPSECEALLDEHDPDIVLLDIQMPEMNGFDVLKMIRGSRRHTTLPVVILTSSTDDETRIKALKLGATDFLTKPVRHAEMTARVRNVLTVKAHQDHLKNYSRELEAAVARRTAQLEASRKDVVRCLARAGEYRDDDTGQHVLRVGRYARLIGEQLGFSKNVLDVLEPAAQLHDVGKIGIPDSILLKPGKLTDDEFVTMRRHCEYGAAIVAPMAGCEPSDCEPGSESRLEELRQFLKLSPGLAGGLASPLLEVACRITLTHHERWDGTGYPFGLAGVEIPIEGRITAVADVFDALSSERPYKRAFELDVCLKILHEGRGSHFDPTCLDAFLSRLDDVQRVQKELADK